MRIVVLAILLAALGLPGGSQARQEAPAEVKPAAEPEKKPDAFRYFFGKKKEEKEKKAVKATAAETKHGEAPASAADPLAPATPAPATLPAATAPESAPASTVSAQPQAAARSSSMDAFQYFFGRGSQPVHPESKEPEPEKKPVDAFELFFGKNGRAGGTSEPAEETRRPPAE